MISHEPTHDIRSQHNRTDLLDLLLKHGADIDQVSSDGETALLGAIKADDHILSTWLVNHNARSNLQDYREGQTAFHLAAVYGHISPRKLIYERGDSPDIAGQCKHAPLRRPAAEDGQDGDEPRVRNGEASIDVRDRSGITPLGLAVGAGHTDCIHFLLLNGANPEVVTRDQQSVWHLTVRKDFKKTMVDVLEKFSTEKLRDVPDVTGWTPLMYALKSNQVQWARYLWESGASPTNTARGEISIDHITAARNSTRSTSILWLQASVQSFAFLNQVSADLDTMDGAGSTPLMVSAALGDIVGVACLLKYRANPRAMDTCGWTALHYTLAWRQVWRSTDSMAGKALRVATIITELLLKAGADTNQRDMRRMTASMMLDSYEIGTDNSFVSYWKNTEWIRLF